MLHRRSSSRPHSACFAQRPAWPVLAGIVAVVASVAAAADPVGAPPATPAAAPTSGPARMTGPQRAAEAERLGKLALAAYDRGDYVAASDLADQAFRNRSDQPDATITFALLLKEREPRESLDLVRKYTSTDQGMRDYRGFEVAGDIYLRSNSPGQAANSYSQALRWAENVTSSRPVKSEIQMKLAEAQSMRQLCRAALANAEKAGLGLQQTADLQWRMAKVYSKCGKGTEAAAAMESAIKLLRGEIEAMKRDELKQFNELYTRLTMRDEILTAQYKALNEALERSAAEKKQSPETRVQMARVVLEQGENDRMTKLTRAAGLMQDAIQQDAKRIEYYLELAAIEEAMGFRTSAVAALLTARSVNPSDPRVTEALRRYGQGVGGGPSTQPTNVRPAPASQP